MMDRGKLRIGKDGTNGTHAILGDQIGVVAAAVADVQPPHLAPGNAAAPAEKAVRNGQEFRPKDVDFAHTQARMMMSSSACSPTMNL